MPGSFQGYNKKMFLLIQDISSRGRVFINCHGGSGEGNKGKVKAVVVRGRGKTRVEGEKNAQEWAEVILKILDCFHNYGIIEMW